MITHDRWQRIKEIFHSAQDRNPAERSDFLTEVCGDDVSMREEVEALLTADASNEDFLSSPAYEFAAGMLASEASEFSPGQKVGRYEIVCSLGAGGMGQIYLAHDAQLSRKIALKLISREFATDPRRVLRFEQEARAASALSHPNVCVIHEIGITDNGRHFIAMEYIQGITLRDQLARGALKPLEALQVAIQVGAALASAHAVGIVHRDIKPENIMLRPDGYVKVVDFGLAKLTEILPQQQRLDEADTKVWTEPRTLMGTVKYMSPEQLREGSVDEQTDIWSLGIVLYEMLTGVTPFEARSRNDSIVLILGSRPTELLLPEELPVKFREIVKKALEKDCAERYQTVKKLTSDLSTLKRELERNAETNLTPDPGIQPSLPVYTPSSHEQKLHGSESGSAIFARLKSQAMLTADSLLSEIRTHKAAALFAGATGVLALLLFLPVAARWLNGFMNPANPLQEAAKVVPAPTMKTLTNAGTSVCSVISFDGKLVAHAEEQNGKQHLVVTNTATSGSSVAVPPDDVQYLGISFSRDGNYLYFTRKEKNGAGILYRLAWPGTNPIKLKNGVDSPISFSPQGDRFAFVRYDEVTTEYSLMLSDIDGTNEQVVASRKDGDTFSVYGAAWSPDGNMIVCPTGHWKNGFRMNLVGFDLKNGSDHAIGDLSWFSILQVAWRDDMTSLIISARERETSPFQLWRIRLSDGAAQRITHDLNEYRGVSLSGENIVTVRINLSWRIWVLTLDESQKATAIASGVGLHYGLSWTSKGRIVFSSMGQDRLNISRIDADGSNPVQLTVNAGDNYTPAASSDGRYIVFASNRNGPFNIWRMNADDGSDPTQLTFSDGNFYPSCSPDNKWVAYDNQVKSTLSVWKVPLEGGEPVRVGERYRMPVFSPDNQFLACRTDLESRSRNVAIFSTQGGRPLRHVPIPIQEWQRVQWLANGRELSYVKNVDGYSNIWTYDLDTGASKQLTNFNSDLIYAYAWSPDYKQVACQRGTKISDVTMISER
jgi:serine/threonine protein kinase/Tol biopolymer transport system component